MSRGDNTPGMSKFAGVIDSMINKRKDESLILDYGVIQGDLSLVTNTFPVAIPKSDYMCCRHLQAIPEDKRWTTESAGSHTHPGGYGSKAGSHRHKFQPHWVLEKGDRVLVAWVQNDPVVIDVLVHASDVF